MLSPSTADEPRSFGRRWIRARLGNRLDMAHWRWCNEQEQAVWDECSRHHGVSMSGAEAGDFETYIPIATIWYIHTSQTYQLYSPPFGWINTLVYPSILLSNFS